MLSKRISAGWRSQLSALEGDFDRILVVRLDNIGDLVMLGPALRALRAAYPRAEITLMASPAGSQVAPLLPWIDGVIVWRAVWQDVSADLPLDPAREISLAMQLRQRQFEVAFIFTSFTQSPYPPAYACYLAGIPIRVGHSKEFGGGVLSHCAEPPLDSGHQVDRNLSLLKAVGVPVPRGHLELSLPEQVQQSADQILESVGIDLESPFILLAPGASCATRRYDPERFASVAQMLVSTTDLPLVVVGSPRETGIVESVAAGARQPRPDRVKSLVGMTSVPDLAAIIRRSSLVIANNSASLHFADAFMRPMVILYSGTEYESQWKPRRAPARLLRRPTHCSPCYNFNCPYAMECLDIAPEEVVAAALEMLAREFSTVRADLKSAHKEQEEKIGAR
jgi:lipopolysaccharide heptosyltransferase II